MKNSCFSVNYRNKGHVDIYDSAGDRIFAIRGEGTGYFIRDTRSDYALHEGFKSSQGALNWALDQLMEGWL